MPQRLGPMIRTLRELAAKAKMARSYLVCLESGERKSPFLTILKRLAEALDVPVTALRE
jgi:transcriptional regulator with XRE-family HTH domain